MRPRHIFFDSEFGVASEFCEDAKANGAEGGGGGSFRNGFWRHENYIPLEGYMLRYEPKLVLGRHHYLQKPYLEIP